MMFVHIQTIFKYINILHIYIYADIYITIYIVACHRGPRIKIFILTPPPPLQLAGDDVGCQGVRYTNDTLYKIYVINHHMWPYDLYMIVARGRRVV